MSTPRIVLLEIAVVAVQSGCFILNFKIVLEGAKRMRERDAEGGKEGSIDWSEAGVFCTQTRKARFLPFIQEIRKEPWRPALYKGKSNRCSLRSNKNACHN